MNYVTSLAVITAVLVGVFFGFSLSHMKNAPEPAPVAVTPTSANVPGAAAATGCTVSKATTKANATPVKKRKLKARRGRSQIKAAAIGLPMTLPAPAAISAHEEKLEAPVEDAPEPVATAMPKDEAPVTPELSIKDEDDSSDHFGVRDERETRRPQKKDLVLRGVELNE